VVENTQVSADQGSKSWCNSTQLGYSMAGWFAEEPGVRVVMPCFLRAVSSALWLHLWLIFLKNSSDRPFHRDLLKILACPLEMYFFAKILLNFQHHMSAYS